MKQDSMRLPLSDSCFITVKASGPDYVSSSQAALRERKSKVTCFRLSGRQSPDVRAVHQRPGSRFLKGSNLGRKHMGFGDSPTWVQMVVLQVLMVLTLNFCESFHFPARKWAPQRKRPGFIGSVNPRWEDVHPSPCPGTGGKPDASDTSGGPPWVLGTVGGASTLRVPSSS